jgi:hypothetical protein
MVWWQQYSAEIIGIAGTLLGTILGWVLGKLNFGKLNIYVHSWVDEFLYNDNHGFMCPSSSVKQTEYYGYSFSLEIYNSSEKTKIMRNIEVMFMEENKICFINTPNDSASRTGEMISVYKEIEPVNIPARTVIKVDLSNGFHNNELSFIWNVNRVILKYVDEHNRTKKLLIKKEQYSNYFDNHKTEDTQNV